MLIAAIKLVILAGTAVFARAMARFLGNLLRARIFDRILKLDVGNVDKIGATSAGPRPSTALWPCRPATASTCPACSTAWWRPPGLADYGNHRAAIWALRPGRCAARRHTRHRRNLWPDADYPAVHLHLPGALGGFGRATASDTDDGADGLSHFLGPGLGCLSDLLSAPRLKAPAAARRIILTDHLLPRPENAPILRYTSQ